MKRVRSTMAAMLLAVSICGYADGRAGSDEADFYDRAVMAVVARGQLRDGELVEKLAALGPAAIPALHRAMMRDEEPFPLKYVRAFDVIGDARATEPLLDFLEKRRPFTDHVEQVLITHALLVLARIGNKPDDPLLEEIFRSAIAHPRIRLYAAAALTTAKDGPLKREATAYVFDEYTNDEPQSEDPNERVLDDDFYEALVILDTERSIQYLAGVLGAGVMRHNAQRIIPYFATLNGPVATNALLAVADNEAHYEMPERLSAREGVIGKIDRGLADRKAKALWVQSIEGGGSESTVNRAADLVARAGQP
ncbi:MAG: hypothetical protein AAGE85_04550 [Pseudomonadota bacterium]